MTSYLEINEIFAWDGKPTLFVCVNYEHDPWYICALHHVGDDGRLWCLGAHVVHEDLIRLYRLGKSTAYSILADSDWYGWVVSNPDYPLDRFEKVEMTEEEKQTIKAHEYFNTEDAHGDFYFDGYNDGRMFGMSIQTDTPYECFKREFRITAFRLSQVGRDTSGDDGKQRITLTRTDESTLRWHEDDKYYGIMSSGPDDFWQLQSDLRYTFWMCRNDFSFEESGNTIVITVPKSVPVEISVFPRDTVPNDYDQEKYREVDKSRQKERRQRQDEVNSIAQE